MTTSKIFQNNLHLDNKNYAMKTSLSLVNYEKNCQG